MLRQSLLHAGKLFFSDLTIAPTYDIGGFYFLLKLCQVTIPYVSMKVGLFSTSSFVLASYISGTFYVCPHEDSNKGMHIMVVPVPVSLYPLISHFQFWPNDIIKKVIFFFVLIIVSPTRRTPGNSIKMAEEGDTFYVTEDTIDQVISEISGIPIGKLDTGEK